MKFLIILSFILLVALSSCFARDLMLGTTYNGRLVWQQKAEYMAIPFKKRVKEVFYSNPGQQLIKGIIAKDLDHTEAEATVTAGGIDSSFANIKLKSTRGGSLNYQIEFYV